MLFSKSCEYALQAMIYLAVRKEKAVISEIADSIQQPNYYLSKILQKLVKANLLISEKGPRGGYQLSTSADNITLAHVIQALDGLDSMRSCGLGYPHCSDASPCPIHNDYTKFQSFVLNMVSNKTLLDIANHYEDGKIVIFNQV